MWQLVELVIDNRGVFNELYFPLGRLSTEMIGRKSFKSFRPQNPKLELYKALGGSKSKGYCPKPEICL